MPLQDIARPRNELVSARPDTPLPELAQLMDERRVGCVVIERENRPAGIVTDRDLGMRAVGAGKDSTELTARDVMTDDPYTAESGDGVFELCAQMREHGVRRMPVVEDGELTGIVTLDDLVVLLKDEMHNISSVIREESPPYSA
ncbi:CBS domain-containing protein [Natronosalvus rutilus]|uniref:CBS domain-containing protein n=1 Tax=Natronosalvus rutilus TaxID=2953753 RepID=A0A9E7NAK0_9EURY|nr:CBS domain-containing protein [Natronosalvus rutilus]UTF54737.1 CBS domain-containing protein [Natronosalvus rutilus]